MEAVNIQDPVNIALDYNALSLLDVMRARDLYHLHLTERKGVIGTAVGRYLIRKEDSWPNDRHKHKATGPKTLQNTEIRKYSWPCVLVFVEKWMDHRFFGKEGAKNGHGYKNMDYVPDRLHMPDGKVVPVCVIEAPPDLKAPEQPVRPRLPKNFIGGGYPVFADVQGEEHVASIGCLVTDGHLTYAVTNRHVSGNPGETLYSVLEGEKVPIGVSSTWQMGRVAFTEMYPEWPGTNTFLTADVGLIEIADKNRWTPQIYSIGVTDAVADFSTQNLSLELINCDVRAYGAASYEMHGRVWGLFYRYKSVAGFEYVADLLIGPRPGRAFKTQHGDSGTLWLLEPPVHDPNNGDDSSSARIGFRPIAIQWGGFVFTDSGGQQRQPFALATLLSTVCQKLDVDFVRDWGFSLPEYWGTVGHFTIANMACTIAGSQGSKLRKLMEANLENITIQLEGITVEDTKGLSKGDFVPLADVPDLVWKMPSGDGSRGPRGRNPEQPNHFADMDQDPPDGTPTLLELCKDPNNVVPAVWIEYARKFPPKKGSKDAAAEMGLLPFRVWQLYDAMVEFVKAGQRDEFICAAGTLAHYMGDACQPLHISFLHHGDPDNPVTKTVEHTRGKKAGTSEEVNVSQGVHEDYEQTMFKGQQGETMKTRLQTALGRSSANGALVRGGHEAAVRTVELMRNTFNTIQPADICKAYDAALRDDQSKSQILSTLWRTFGADTVKVMADGCRHLALLWESAWEEGTGDSNLADLGASSPDDLKSLYNKKDFLQSFLLTEIGNHLQGLSGGEPIRRGQPPRGGGQHHRPQRPRAKGAAR
jgi:hypothetical protein